MYLICLYCLLITLAKNFDQNQARQNVGPDLNPKFLTLIIFLKEFYKNVNFEGKNSDSRRQKKKFTSIQSLCSQVKSPAMLTTVIAKIAKSVDLNQIATYAAV